MSSTGTIQPGVFNIVPAANNRLSLIFNRTIDSAGVSRKLPFLYL